MPRSPPGATRIVALFVRFAELCHDRYARGSRPDAHQNARLRHAVGLSTSPGRAPQLVELGAKFGELLAHHVVAGLAHWLRERV